MKYISVAAMMLALTACHSDEEVSAYSHDPNAVRINASIAGMTLLSRANSDATGAVWSNGDQIKVTNTTGIEGKQESAYVYASEENTWAPQGSNYIVWASGDNTFEAFYPYTATSTNSFSAFTLPADQSALVGGLLAADWMTSTVTTAKTSDCSIDMTFQHKLSKIKVQIVGYNNQYPTPVDVSVAEPVFNIPSTQTPIENKTVTVAESATSIKGYQTTDTEQFNHSFTAIVMPGEYAAGDVLMSLLVNSEPLTVSVNSAIRLDAGKSYTFNLTVGKDKLEIVNVTVNPWTSATLSEGTADELPPYVGLEANIDTDNDAWIITDTNISNAMFNSIATKLKAVAQADPTRRIKLTITGNQGSYTVQTSVFSDCTALYSLDMPNMTSIPQYMCSDCTSLKQINLPKVTSIGQNAFTGTALTSVTLPVVETIGNTSFFNNSQLTSVSMPKIQAIGSHAFNSCLELKTVSLSDDITVLQNYTFAYCNKLETVFASNLITIGEDAFINCYALKSVDLTKVTEVQRFAFCKCHALVDIGTPQLTTIREHAFAGCSALPAIDLTKVVTIESNALEGCASLTSVSLPNITEIPLSLFYECTRLKEFDIPNVTVLGRYAFSKCNSLTTIDLANITEIGGNSFYSCDSLVSVNAPKLVHITGDQAFAWCPALKSVNMPELIDVENSTFLCSALTGTLNFPKLTKCVSATFNDCKFTSITLPNVVEVGPYCFANCDYLESVNLPKATTFADGAFGKSIPMKQLTSVTLGSPVVSFATKAMWNNIPTENVTLTLSSAQKQMTLQETVYVPTEEDFTDWGKGKTFCGQTFKEIKQAN